jgi:2-iminoacetate synthase
VQTICAFRITFPEVGIVLSTREPAPLRDALAPLGITLMSAGSHTEPGGYTGAGTDDLHLTVRGRRIEVPAQESKTRAEGQFGIADERSAQEVAEMLRASSLDPVWKDWDPSFLAS